MAEEGQPKGKRSNTFLKVRNWVLTALDSMGILEKIEDWTGQAPEYRRYEGQPMDRFQPVQKIIKLITPLTQRTSDVLKKEREWDEIEKVRENIEQIYSRARIYLNPLNAEYEWNIYQNGVKKDSFDYTYIEMGSRVYSCPIPLKTKIRYEIPGYRRDWVVEVSPFGYFNRETYIGLYQKLIEDICEDRRREMLAEESDPGTIDAINTNVNAVKSEYHAAIANLMNSYCGSEEKEAIGGLMSLGIEREYYTIIGNGKRSIDSLSGPALSINELTLRKEVMRKYYIYFNTFNVVNPVLYGTGADSAKVLDRLDDPKHKWEKREGEIWPGMDKLGYPLEVETDGRVMIDHYDEKGNRVGSDSCRPVLPKFIRPLDPLERINYETVFYDTVRDDLRDGRYHPNSLTITDYMQANNPSLFHLWEKRKRGDHNFQTRIEAGNVVGQNIREVRLNNWTENGKRKYKVIPTDKDPAFDLRSLSPDWRHIGRKYYYMFPDHSFEMRGQNKDAHSSSRGISMYIIEHLTRQIEEVKDLKEALLYIERQEGSTGFDYGPRAWSTWGKTMTKNVYDWDSKMEEVNKPAPKADLGQLREKLEGEYKS